MISHCQAASDPIDHDDNLALFRRALEGFLSLSRDRGYRVLDEQLELELEQLAHSCARLARIGAAFEIVDLAPWWDRRVPLVPNVRPYLSWEPSL